jgi:2-dehydropantoate 2-reductase
MQIGLYDKGDHSVTALETSRLHQFASLLTTGKTVFQVVPDVQVQRWEKCAWNAAWNPLTMLTLLDTHAWLSSEGATDLSRRVMSEVVNVARALGVGVDDALVDRHMEKILGMPPIGSSMRTDLEEGRPLELEMIVGYPVRKGKELGVDVGALEILYVLLGAVNKRLAMAKAESIRRETQ